MCVFNILLYIQVISKFRLYDVGYGTFTKLFDASVVPILNYSSEIWGYQEFTKCDTIVNRAMRYFLGVHRFAATAAIQGDMAWLPLRFRQYMNILRFWNHLVKMDHSRLVKRIFRYYYDHPHGNWCSDVHQIAKLMQSENIYDNMGIFDLELVKGKCAEIMKNVRDDETGRLRKLTVNERLCQICNSNNVENEFHFLFHCDKFKSERENFYSLCITNYSNFVYLCDEDKLNILMNEGNNWRILSNYLVNIWEKRKHIMYK